MALFNEYTTEELIEQAIANAPDDIDTRQGSVFLMPFQVHLIDLRNCLLMQTSYRNRVRLERPQAKILIFLQQISI